MPRHRAIRHGLTLIELCLVVTIIGLTTLIASRQLLLHLDRAAARAAVAEAATVVVRARDEAIAQRAMTSIRVDTSAAVLELRARGAPVARAALGHAHGVTLSSNRDSLTFDVRGLGYGAANLTMVARRGRAAETLVVSRLGRVRF
ncbi:MAG: prepilin-type N-terminal cleavage/methylation domain-containing protein [Gemmatimonadaceae bacterium]